MTETEKKFRKSITRDYLIMQLLDKTAKVTGIKFKICNKIPHDEELRFKPFNDRSKYVVIQSTSKTKRKIFLNVFAKIGNTDPYFEDINGMKVDKTLEINVDEFQVV